MNAFVAFIVSTITISTVFLYGCVGEIITEKSGHLNLGIPGTMCMGFAGGCWGISLYVGGLAPGAEPSWIVLFLISLIFTLAFGAFGGLIYAFLTVTLKSNQNITGLALTIFGTGFCQAFMDISFKGVTFASSSVVLCKGLPFADSLGWFGEILLSHGIYVYIAIAIAIIAAIVLRKTRVGLNLRAVGENPATADAAGVNVTAYKYGAILIGSAIAGLGGFFYVMGFIGGSVSNSATTIEGLGWLSIALVIFSLWKPDLAILGSFIFGALYIAPSKILGISFTGRKAFDLLPYLVTIVVLIVTSVLDSKENQGPAALGAPYFREER